MSIFDSANGINELLCVGHCKESNKKESMIYVCIIIKTFLSSSHIKHLNKKLQIIRIHKWAALNPSNDDLKVINLYQKGRSCLGDQITRLQLISLKMQRPARKASICSLRRQRRGPAGVEVWSTTQQLICELVSTL